MRGIEMDGVINYDDFTKVDLRVATILEAKEHSDPKVDKLLVIKVKVGEEERQIVAGIKKHYTIDQLVNTQILIVANLEPRVIRGESSHGMLLAASDKNGNFALIRPDKLLEAGSKAQ